MAPEVQKSSAVRLFVQGNKGTLLEKQSWSIKNINPYRSQNCARLWRNGELWRDIKFEFVVWLMASEPHSFHGLLNTAQGNDENE